MTKIPKPTQNQLNKNHIPVKFTQGLTICTYGGQPILGDTKCVIYMGDKRLDRCDGWQLDKVIERWIF